MVAANKYLDGVGKKKLKKITKAKGFRKKAEGCQQKTS